MATSPEAPPATMANEPVSGLTSRRRPSNIPNNTLMSRVATATPSTSSQCGPSAPTASRETMVPM